MSPASQHGIGDATPNGTHGLVLPGGGARAAYQVGVLKGISEILGSPSRNPFPVISGTSAGGINAGVIAANALDFHAGVERLEAIWRNFHIDQVFSSDTRTIARTGARWLGTFATGGLITEHPRSLLDNTPLRDLLERHIRFDRIEQAIDSNALRAVAVTASGYSSAHSLTFFQSNGTLKPWSRNRRQGERVHLTLDHLMATSAIPLIFPPVRIKGEYFGDGAVRQLMPLSAPIRLGADRMVVIGVRDGASNEIPDEQNPAGWPSFGEISGYMLDTIFSDGLYTDLERLHRINSLVDNALDDKATAHLRPVECLVIMPSRDIRKIAAQHIGSLPRSFRLLLKGIGASASNPQLLSYLLFESDFTQELIELGHGDAMNQRDDILQFFNADAWKESGDASAIG